MEEPHDSTAHGQHEPLTQSRSSSVAMATPISRSSTPSADASRMFSTSYFKPRNLSTYESYMRAINNEGRLEVKLCQEAAWHRRFCILKEGALSVHKDCGLLTGFKPDWDSPVLEGERILAEERRWDDDVERKKLRRRRCGSIEGNGGRTDIPQQAGEGEGPDDLLIPLENVTCVRSVDQMEGSHAFQMVTPEQTYFFRAMSRVDMQEWLFAFHSSLVVVAARIKAYERPFDPAALRENPRLADRRLRIMQELGHGHGHSQSMKRRFRQVSQPSWQVGGEDPGPNSSVAGGLDSLVGPRGGLPMREQSFGGLSRGRGIAEGLACSLRGGWWGEREEGHGGRQQQHGDHVGRDRGQEGESKKEAAVQEESIWDRRVADARGGGSGEGSEGRWRRSTEESSSLESTDGADNGGCVGPPEGFGATLSDAPFDLDVPTALPGLTSLTSTSSLPAHTPEPRAALTTSLPTSTTRPRHLSIDLVWQRRPLSEAGPEEEERDRGGSASPGASPPAQAESHCGSVPMSCMESPGDEGSFIFEMSMEEVELASLALNNGLTLLPTRPTILTSEQPQAHPISSGTRNTTPAHNGTADRPTRPPSIHSNHTSSDLPTPCPARSPSCSIHTATELPRAPPSPEERTGPPRRGGLGWSAGVISLQGIRTHQEDQYTAIRDLNSLCARTPRREGESQGFYAIYDGHCGVRAARYAREILHHYLIEDPAFLLRPEEAMMRVCRRVDAEVLELCARESLYCGTTAILVLIRGRRLFVGNLGDCAAVLSRHRQAIPLSTSQTPGRQDELERIERANGWVTTEKELFVGQLHRMDLDDPAIALAVEKRVQWVTIYRVCGELSVSRSIGDPDFKGFNLPAPRPHSPPAPSFSTHTHQHPNPISSPSQQTSPHKPQQQQSPQQPHLPDLGSPSDFPFDYPPGHSGRFRADLVIAEPEVRQHEITEEDDFLLIACDGFWDVLDGQEAVQHTSELLAKGLDPSDAAARLGSLALRLGSSDNVTVMVVCFEHPQRSGQGREAAGEEVRIRRGSAEVSKPP